jgi:TRAP-type C4-dicarboxylate transport system permease small subunit
MKKLIQVEGALARVEAVVVQVLMAAMFVAGVAQVLIRMAGWRSAGTDEITTLSLAVLTFAGAGLVVYTADNVAVEVLEYIKNDRIRRTLRLIGLGALGLFSLVFGYYSWDFAARVGLNERTLQLGLPVMISAGAMVLGAALIFIHTVGSAVRLVRDELLDDDPMRERLMDRGGAVE